jgi:hypothetical protein
MVHSLANMTDDTHCKEAIHVTQCEMQMNGNYVGDQSSGTGSIIFYCMFETN